jgi:dihydroorotase
LHVRDGSVLVDVLGPMLARGSVARAILMPNLQPPVTDASMAAAYRTRVMDAVKQIDEQRRREDSTAKPSEFTPLMTLYLTDQTTPQDIKAAKSVGMEALICGLIAINESVANRC